MKRTPVSARSARRCAILSLVFGLGVQLASAQDVSRYRAYALGSTVEAVVAASDLRAADVRTLHERPARIQELRWRAPYVNADAELADPVREVVFTFLDGTLYQIVVGYDRARTDGLTDEDIVGGVSAVYGRPAMRAAQNLPAAADRDGVVLAQWESAASSVTLVRDRYSRELQLILLARVSNARARGAVREAIRLDSIEAPQREVELRKKELADATTARARTRIANKAAFRP